MGFRNSILAGEELVRSGIRSPDYDPGLAGWRIAQDGTAEFNDVTVRGEVIVGPGPPTGSQIRLEAAGPSLARITLESSNGQDWYIRSTSPSATIAALEIVNALAGAILSLTYDTVAPASRGTLAADHVALLSTLPGGELKIGRNTTAQDQMAAWSTHVPAINAVSNYGAGNFRTGEYQVIGRTCWFNLRVLFGAAGLAFLPGNWTISLPLPAAGPQQTFVTGWARDGGLFYPIGGHFAGGSVINLVRFGSAAAAGTAGGPVDANLPFVWGAGDELQVSGCYQLASAL